MKTELIKIASNNNVSIRGYKTYRSDMGCQVYNILVLFEDGEVLWFNDSYVVGELNAKDWILKSFESFLLLRHN